MRIENEKRKEETKLILRVYKPADCKALTELFYETVHSVNTKDYTKEQVDAWADGNVDLEKWNQSFLEHYTVIAEEENGIIGFGDISDTGYLDRVTELARKTRARFMVESFRWRCGILFYDN